MANCLDTVRPKTVAVSACEVTRVSKRYKISGKHIGFASLFLVITLSSFGLYRLFTASENRLFAQEGLLPRDKAELYETKVELAKEEYRQELAKNRSAQEQRMITNEQNRVEAEQARVMAEQARVKAEQEAKVASQIAAQVTSRRYVANRKGGFDNVYAAAETRFGVSRHLIAAVHYVESGQSGDTTRSSYAGAQGPMQFMPGTFRAYASDGDGDGAVSINDAEDSIFTAAKYLAANGAASGKVRSALYRYNHSYSYVEKVLSIARSFGFVD